MEMEPDWLDPDGISANKTSLMQLLPPGSASLNDIFGDPQVKTRVGDKFQVEIPPMLTESEHVQLLMNPADSEAYCDVSHSFLIGLPVPVTWVHDEVNDSKDEGSGFLSKLVDALNANESLKSRKNKKNHSSMKKKLQKLGTADGKESKPIILGLKGIAESNADRACKSKTPLPGSSCDPWKDAEVETFLLGLYIFGKNFVQVKKFVEDKEMGDILSLYYGTFYRSDKYRRWSDCRKTRSRKCVYGRKIFSGWRQQELLCRLLPHVPEESQSTLLEVSKSFAEGRTSLDNYVTSLKMIVGIPTLVEAVGIGKGKEDLTSLAMVPVKTNQVFPFCSEVPAGKACSSLTSSDIIKFLTGGFRLSKTRCNDIFWEAVWPRLLARGWHSEEPKNQGYVSSKHCLVFLMPGVKKFSRRKLVKGDHYFDSVSDVLSKVASEPKLLELETEEARVGSCNEELGWVPEVPSDQDDPSDRKSHCYLKPRVSNFGSSNRMKFTIVDSSLVDGGKLAKVRELRYSPVDFKITSKMTPVSKETKGHFFEESLDEYDPNASYNPLEDEEYSKNVIYSRGIFDTGGPNCMKFTVVDTSSFNGGKVSQEREITCLPIKLRTTLRGSSSAREKEQNSSNDSLDNQRPVAVNGLLNGDKSANTFNCNKKKLENGGSDKHSISSHAADETVKRYLDQKTSLSEDYHSKKSINHHFNRRVKSGDSHDSASLPKRRRLTACSKAETSSIGKNFLIGLESKQVRPSCSLNSKGHNAKSQSGPQERTHSCSTKDCMEEETAKSHNKKRKQQPGSSFGVKNCMEEETAKSHNKKRKQQPGLSFGVKHCQVPIISENELSMRKEKESRITPNDSHLPNATRNIDPEVSRRAIMNVAEQQPTENPGSLGDENVLLMKAEDDNRITVEKPDPKVLRTNVNERQPSVGPGTVDSENELALRKREENRIILNDSCMPSTTNKLDPEALRNTIDIGVAEQECSVNPRRQSTRNRELSTRALEALESGFLNLKRRQKSKEVLKHEIPFVCPSRKARSRAKGTSSRSSAGAWTVDAKEDKGVGEAFEVEKDEVSETS